MKIRRLSWMVYDGCCIGVLMIGGFELKRSCGFVVGSTSGGVVFTNEKE